MPAPTSASQPDRAAAMRQAMEAYQARQAAAARQQAAARAAAATGKPAPAAPAQPDMKAFMADQARKTGLTEQDLTALFKAYDRKGAAALNAGELDDVLGAAKQYMATKPPEEERGWFGKAAGWLADKAGDAVDAVADTTGDVVKAVVTGQSELIADGLALVGADGAADKVRTVGEAAGNLVDTALDRVGKVADNTLDIAGIYMAEGAPAAAEALAERTLGPQVPEYKDQIDGVVGSLTNRLAPGKSAYVSLTGKVTLPSEALGFPNVEGGVKVSAALKRTEDGKIELVLSGEASAGAAYEASVRARAKLEILGTKVVGAEAGAVAKVGVEASASAELTLSFDPKNPADVARLKALLEPPESSAANPAGMAINAGKALSDAMDKNFGSVEVGARFGATAEARVYGEVGALNTAGDKPGGVAKDGARVGAEAGVSAGGGIGLSYKRDAQGNTTEKVQIDAKLRLTAGAYADGKGLGAVQAGGMTEGDMNEAFLVQRDKDGKVTGLSIESTQANASGSKSEVLTKALNPAGVAAAQALIEKGASPYQAFRQVEQNPANLSFEKKTTTKDNFTLFAAAFDVTVGAKLEADINLSIGTGTEKVERIDRAAYDRAVGKQDEWKTTVNAGYVERGAKAPTGGVNRAGVNLEYDVNKGTVEVAASDRRHVEIRAKIDPTKTGDERVSFSVANKARPKPLVRDAVQKVEEQRAERIARARGEGKPEEPAKPGALKLTVGDFQAERGASGLKFTRFAVKPEDRKPGEDAPEVGVGVDVGEVAAHAAGQLNAIQP